LVKGTSSDTAKPTAKKDTTGTAPRCCCSPAPAAVVILERRYRFAETVDPGVLVTAETHHRVPDPRV